MTALIVFIFACVAPAAASAAESLPRSVLYLDHNGPAEPFGIGMAAAFHSSMSAGSTEHIAIFAETLDLIRSSGPRYEEVLKSYLREKYRDTPIGLIVGPGTAALSFILHARAEMWPDVPVIFVANPDTAAEAGILGARDIDLGHDRIGDPQTARTSGAQTCSERDATVLAHDKSRACGAGAHCVVGCGIGRSCCGARPAADVPPRKVIRTQRLRVSADLFQRDTVSFKRARVDAGGTIRDGHTDLYSMVLIRRDRICASPEGARWACGQRAFMAMRQLVKGQPISCSFMAAAGAPKAVCWIGDKYVTQWLRSQGWAELAEGVTDESYRSGSLRAAQQSQHLGRWSAVIWPVGPISPVLTGKRVLLS